MNKIGLLLVLVSMTGLTACQNLRPQAQGLPTLQQLSQQAAVKQDQVDIQWKDQSFSFLLYQQQQADYLQILALSVSGQILFELHYDGQKVKVIQRIEAMKYLPFDFLMRDIFWGTLPAEVVEQQTQALMLNFVQNQQNGSIERSIMQNQQQKLRMIIQADQTIIDNLSVPYQITLYRSQQDFFNKQ